MEGPYTVPKIGWTDDSFLDACTTAMIVQGHVEDASGQTVADYRKA